METLGQILQRVGSYTEQSGDVPTGTDLTLRVNYANQAMLELSSKVPFKHLKETYIWNSTTSALATQTLPTNLKSFASDIYIFATDQTTPKRYEVIEPAQRLTKASSAEYVYWDGNFVTGKFLHINPAMASGATGSFDYYSTPSTLATVSDVPNVPDSEFLTLRITARVLESRGDSRFTEVKNDADRYLKQLVENHNAGDGVSSNLVPSYYTNNNFIIGE